MQNNKIIKFKKYGKPPYNVVVVHGGPGGPGTMSDLAINLSKKIGVLEPFQTKLSVKDQTIELKEIIDEYTDDKDKVTLIGHSWGASLSYLYTANNPNKVKKLIMVGSAVFESKYAKKILETRLKRLSEKDKKIIQNLLDTKDSKINGKALKQMGEIFLKTDNVAPSVKKLNIYNLEKQAEIHEKVWADFLTIRKNKKFLQLASKINCPVVVIHGDYDPHPFIGIKEPLEKRIKNIEFYLLKKCGHTPWIEKNCASKFYSILFREF